MCHLIFSKVELATSNVGGILGSKKLSEEKLNYLKKVVFNKYSCGAGENDEKVWKEICGVVNEVHRNVKNTKRRS